MGQAVAGEREGVQAVTHLRRRGTLQQGQALELLGHAVEYLVDSQVFAEEERRVAVAEAVQVLKRASRAVFAECPEVVTLRGRVERWLGRMAWERTQAKPD